MVISHDKTFLEELEPTHVITVRGGRVDLQVRAPLNQTNGRATPGMPLPRTVRQERGLREEDWNDPIDSRESDDACLQKFAAPAGGGGGKATAAAVLASINDVLNGGDSAEGAAGKGGGKKGKKKAKK